MKKLTIVLALLLSLALMAQTTGPGQITLKPLASASGCISDSTGAVLCAATDGFYISVAGGTFQKVNTGTPVPPPQPTSISCTTASLSTGSSGTLNASGCTFK